MSKKNKNIENVRILPISKKGQSMVEWFMEVVAEDGSISNVISAISCLNAQTLTFDFLDKDKQNKMMIEIIDVVDYIISEYGDNKAFLSELSENWLDTPRIFAMAETFADEIRISRTKDEYSQFLPYQQKTVDMLLDYIWNIREDRSLSFAYSDVLDGETPDNINLPRFIPREHLESVKEWLKTLLIDFVSLGGGLLFRYVDPKNRKMFILNGFRCIGGNVESINAKELKYCVERQPDGTMMPIDNEEYKVAPMIFPKQ